MQQLALDKIKEAWLLQQKKVSWSKVNRRLSIQTDSSVGFECHRAENGAHASIFQNDGRLARQSLW
jgi:hypothetical protein